jgi:hypothetical protein
MKYKTFKFLENLDMKLSELLLANESMSGQLSKIDTEINAKFDELNGAVNTLTVELADASLTPAQADSVAAVQAKVDALDSIVADPVPVEPAPVA